MEAKVQFKNERNRVQSVKILEDILIQRRAESFFKKDFRAPAHFEVVWINTVISFL